MYFKVVLSAMYILTSLRPVHALQRIFNLRMKTSVASFDYDSFPAMTPYIKSTPTYKDKVKSKAKGKDKANHEPVYRPRTANQKAYVSHLVDPATPIVFGIGPAGCGKTLFACLTAINALKAGAIQKIVLTRPIVPVEDEELGFLPGTLVKKMDPWTRPLFDIFLETYKQHELDFMISSGVIEISPLAYMRGRTFKRAFIIADEMQNSSPSQMLMLTTRIGEGSKMVITGDLKQSDRCANNGLLDFMTKYTKYIKSATTSNVGIQLVHMDQADIQRSPIVTKILDIYETQDLITDSSYTPPDLSKAPKHKVEPPVNITYDFYTPLSMTNVTNATNKTITPYVPPDLSKAPKHNEFKYSVDSNSLVNFTTFYNTSLSSPDSIKPDKLSSNNDAALFPLDKEPKRGSDADPMAVYRRGW